MIYRHHHHQQYIHTSFAGPVLVGMSPLREGGGRQHCEPTWHVSNCSDEASCKLLYSIYFTYNQSNTVLHGNPNQWQLIYTHSHSQGVSISIFA